MKELNVNRMEDVRELTTWGLTILTIVFVMAIYGNSNTAMSADQDTETTTELPEEHPGGYELYLASTELHE